MKSILLIGCGHMGDALLTSWIRSKKYKLNVVDPIKYNNLKKKYKNEKINFFKSISNIKNNITFDFIILAIKPSETNNALNELTKIEFKNSTVLISVIAGKKFSQFKNKFKNLNYFVRVMPNMPASIGESMNCIVADKKVALSKKKEITKLFSFSGKTLILQNEKQIDMATAISGSGPGFVYNIIDAMEKAAIDLGFKKKIAKILVTQTFKGSIDLLLKKNLSANELVATVATKGGTTEAGLKIMNKNKVHNIFSKVTKASYKKAQNQGTK